MGDAQSDSIQYLNFAKKWFIQYSIQYCFTQDSIQNIIHFKINSGDSIQNIIQFKINSGNSIQKIIQFNSQGMINTGLIGKVPKNWPKSVQNRQKRGLFIKNGKYRFKISLALYFPWPLFRQWKTFCLSDLLKFSFAQHVLNFWPWSRAGLD